MNNEELIKKIDKEMDIWKCVYEDINPYFYAIAAICWRTANDEQRSQYTILDTELKVADILIKINDALDAYYYDIDTVPLDCINAIFSQVMTYFGDKGKEYIDELQNAGKEGSKLNILSTNQAIDEIAEQIIARDNIRKEAAISMRTLQWVKDLINKKEA